MEPESVGTRRAQVNIAKAREVYRPVATRGSLVYFLIDNLNALNRVYHYSMANFVYILGRGMDLCPGGRDESKVRQQQVKRPFLPTPPPPQPLLSPSGSLNPRVLGNEGHS